MEIREVRLTSFEVSLCRQGTEKAGKEASEEEKGRGKLTGNEEDCNDDVVPKSFQIQSFYHRLAWTIAV